MSTMKKIDPLTGYNYESELQVYVRYHGLTQEQAAEVMAVTASHAARSAKFHEFLEHAN